MIPTGSFVYIKPEFFDHPYNQVYASRVNLNTPYKIDFSVKTNGQLYYAITALSVAFRECELSLVSLTSFRRLIFKGG